MIIIDNYSQVTAQIETERGISREDLTIAIEQALISACRRKYSEESELDAQIDTNTGEAKIWLTRTVVKTVEDEALEISLKDVKKHSPKVKEGDVYKEEVTPKDFGRIAAQTAKQVIIQRIREAEKNSIYDEFSDKKGTIITGTIQRIEGRNYLINLGRIEALLTPRDQIAGETFQVNEKIKLYLADIAKTPKGPQLIISRAHPGLLECLFSLEVPEIQDGIIEIISIARDAGRRAKVAVKSNNPAIGAVGTCVGHMGGRIQTIIKEIGNEKIDILEWNEDQRQFISNSLKPAKISKVIITNESAKEACVVVAKDQLSLAIGKGGVNVRLAVKLTQWKLDILSEEEYAEKDIQEDGQEPSSFADRLHQEVLNQNETETDAAAVDQSSAEAEDEIKVSVLAKELQLKTAELIEKGAEFDIHIKSNRSKVSLDDANVLREKLSEKEA